MRHVAVILAGGTGTRMGGELPKQLIRVAGKPVVEHTIAAFEASPLIDEVVVVMMSGHLDAVREIVRDGGHHKVSAVIEGGATRGGSTRAALDHLGDRGEGECRVLLHDAARPLVTQTIIADVVAALATHRAVNTAVPSTDTIVQVHPSGPGRPDVIDSQLDRHLLRRVQTPQGFDLSVLRDAYARAEADTSTAGLTSTDDISVVLRHRPDVEIAVVAGDASNIKVTEPIDLIVAERLLTTGP